MAIFGKVYLLHSAMFLKTIKSYCGTPYSFDASMLQVQ